MHRSPASKDSSLDRTANMFRGYIGLIVSGLLSASASVLQAPLSGGNEQQAHLDKANDGKSKLFAVPCPSCDWEYDPIYNVTKNPSNKLLVRLTIEDDDSGLLLNEIGIFPQSKYGNDSWHDPTQIWFDQVPLHTTKQEILDGEYPRVPLKVGWVGMVENPPIPTLGYELSLIQFKVSGLNGKHMTDLPMLFIQVLQADDGELLLLSAAISPSETVPGADLP